jgi:hypothetical protein
MFSNTPLKCCSYSKLTQTYIKCLHMSQQIFLFIFIFANVAVLEIEEYIVI